LFLVLIEFSKPFVIQGFDASLVNFLLNLINGALWSTDSGVQYSENFQGKLCCFQGKRKLLKNLER